MHFFKKRHTAAKIKAILIISLILISIAIVTFMSTGNLKQTSFFTRASGEITYKVMSYNILQSQSDLQDYGRSHQWVEEEMKLLANYMKNNNIELAALQEVVSIKDKNNPDTSNIGALRKELERIGYPMFYTRSIAEHKITSGTSDDEVTVRVFQTFMHRQPAIEGLTQDTGALIVDNWKGGSDRYLGENSIVLETPLGRIRFVNHHPHPVGARAASKELIKFANSLKSDGIPMILMGDFNMVFGPPDRQADFVPYITAIYDAGFYRSCDPSKFPNNNCDDSVRGDTYETEYSIDQILIDKRAPFVVKNAYIDQNKTESDHLPAITELTNFIPTSTPAPPTPLPTLSQPVERSYVCNNDGTATFSWSSVAGNSNYTLRLDYQGSINNSPIYNWPVGTNDISVHITALKYTLPVQPGIRYQWAVSAANQSTPPVGGSWSWNPPTTSFSCNTVPTPTKTKTPTPTKTKTPTPTKTKTPTPTPTKIITPTSIKINTPTPSKTKTPTPTPNCSRKAEGDADCNGSIDLKDAICWMLEAQNKKPANCISADFNGNGKVGTSDLIEFSIWRSSYIKIQSR